MALEERRLVVVTTFYPNACEPSRAVFLESLLGRIKKSKEITVVAPVPWNPLVPSRRLRCLTCLPKREYYNGVEVIRPRYFIIPKLDVLSGVMYAFAVLPALRLLCRNSNILIHAHCAYPDGFGVALAAAILNVPFVLTAHGSDINVYTRRLLIRPQISWALRRAAGIVGVSASINSKMNELANTARKTIHIPCAGYEPAIFYERERDVVRQNLKVAKDAKVVLFVGNLFPIKGVDILITAWSLLTKQRRIFETDRLVIVGEGPLHRRLEKAAMDMSIEDSTVFLGALPNADVALWLNAANTLCLPSYNEGTPNVVVEALASGTPVVASNVGGIPDLFKDGTGGFLVEPGRPEMLAEALFAVLNTNWDRAVLASHVREYTWEAIAQMNLGFLDRVIALGQNYASLV